ncbi:MAG: hypothetical protein WD749_01730 [Phycisphaerales bacterium]
MRPHPTHASHPAHPQHPPLRVAMAAGTLAVLFALAPGAAVAQSVTVRTPPTGYNPGTLDDPSSGGDFELTWHTIDGGGRTFLTGPDYELGSTTGQPDMGQSYGACYEWNGAFWVISASPVTCYANCDHSIVTPVLNVADFGCFLTEYAAGSCYANCDESTTSPILNVADFGCFLTKYAAGCP